MECALEFGEVDNSMAVFGTRSGSSPPATVVGSVEFIANSNLILPIQTTLGKQHKPRFQSRGIRSQNVFGKGNLERHRHDFRH